MQTDVEDDEITPNPVAVIEGGSHKPHERRQEEVTLSSSGVHWLIQTHFASRCIQQILCKACAALLSSQVARMTGW